MPQKKKKLQANITDEHRCIDYKKLHENTGDKCKPILVQSPSIVNHVRLSPQEIEYIIEQKITFND